MYLVYYAMLKKKFKKKLKEGGIEFYKGRPIGGVIKYRSNIFNVAQDLIVEAKHRIITSTYEFEKKSRQAEKIFDAIVDLNTIIDGVARDNYPYDDFDKLSKKDKRKFARMGGYTIPLKVTLSADRPTLFLKNIRDWVDADIIPFRPNRHLLKNTIKLLDRYPYIKLNYEYHTHWELDTNHSKYIIVDNKTLIGSANTNDRSFFEAARVVEGDITDAVVDSFYRDIYPRFSKLKKVSHRSRIKRVGRTLHRGKVGRPKKMKRSRGKSGTGDYFMVTTPPTKMSSISMTKFYSTQLIFLHTMFAHAKKSIKLYTPNLNYKGFVEDIIGSVNRGVHIKIILSQNYQDYGARKDGGTNQQSVDKLERAYDQTTRGRLEIGYFRDHNVPRGDEKIFREKEKNISHVKLYLVDDVCSLWGSMNLDNQSFRSHELSVGSFDGKQVREDVAFFNSVWRHTALALS